MSYSIVTYTGDGSTTTFPINFTLGFISRADVQCRVGSEVDGLGQPIYRSLTWISDGLVQVQGSPAGSGVSIEFTRTVDKDQLIHDYSDGAAITESNLDDSNKQVLMMVHEFLDDRIRVPPTYDLNLNAHKITNLANGTDPQDAVTVAQITPALNALADTVAARDAAIVAQGLAEDAADTAEVFEVGAEAARDLAVLARTGAETAQGLAEDARDLAEARAVAADVAKIDWQAPWAPGTYQIHDAVAHNGSSFIATAVTAEEPSETAVDWDVLALKGEDGVDGADGTGTGDVDGPASSTDSAVALFNGTTGKLLKNGVILGTAANNIVQLDGTAKLPAIDGSQLTNLPAANSFVNNFRLTGVSGTPVDFGVGAYSTLYLTPYNGNQISLYSGTAWETVVSGEVSKVITGLTGDRVYDVFCYNNAGTPTLEFLIWTNNTTRATALTRQDGVLVKTAAPTRVYLGTFLAASSTTFYWTETQRDLWNYYNRVPVLLRQMGTTDSYTYTTATWRKANSAYGVRYTCGVQDALVSVQINATYANTTVSYAMVAVGVNSTSSPSGIYGSSASQQATLSHCVTAEYTGITQIGKQELNWLEMSAAAGTTTWYGDINPGAGVPTVIAPGMHGTIMG